MSERVIKIDVVLKNKHLINATLQEIVKAEARTRNFHAVDVELEGGLAAPLPWTPLDISPFIWLDISENSTVHLSDATHIEQWDDKSGNNNHAIQSILANQPTLENDIKGDYFRIYGFPQHMDISYTLGALNNKDMEIAFIGGGSKPNTRSVLLSMTKAGNYSYTRFEMQISSTFFFYLMIGLPAIFPHLNQPAGSFPAIFDLNKIWNLYCENISDRRIIVDDTLIYSTDPSYPDYNGSSTTDMNTLRIGARINADGSSGFNYAFFREILVFNRRLTAGERLLIKTYWQNKWSL